LTEDYAMEKFRPQRIFTFMSFIY